MQPTIVADPGEEEAPTGITDTFGKPMILDQAGDLEVFVGQEIARFHQRTCGLDRKVFTLPADPEMPFGKVLDRLLAVRGTA